MSMTRRLDRRHFLAGTASATAAALLAACAGETSPTTGAATPTTGAATPIATATAAVAAPTMGAAAPTAAQSSPAVDAAAPTVMQTPPARPATAAGATSVTSPMVGSDGVLRSTLPGVQPAYLRAQPAFRSVQGNPGRGGRITTLQMNGIAPAPPRDQNRYWQELEKRLGVTLEITQVPGASYAMRLAAVTAGGNLPDLTTVNLDSAPDQARIIQQGAYTDLTPFLTGDALKEYPNLARYPDRVWRNARIRGRLYGVPRLLDNGPPLLFLRQDWANKVGVPAPRNANEFLQMMTAFTKNDPDGNGRVDSYGLGSALTNPFGLDALAQMFRVPNGWRRNPDGSLTAAIETDEFRQAVGFMRRLFEAGAYHPDTATMNQNQARDAFAAGKIGAFPGVFTGLPQPNTGLRDRLRASSPPGEAVGLVPFGHDGGKGITHSTPGFAGFVMIPASVGRMGAERVRELLRVLDFFAAPIFSEEYTLLRFGIEGVHHELRPSGERVRNDVGQREISDLYNLNFGGESYYYPHKPDEALYIHGLVTELTSIGIDDPTWGLYSPTFASKRAELTQLQADRVGAIVQGREPLNTLDGLARDWRSRGGDQIRQEFAQALREA